MGGVNVSKMSGPWITFTMSVTSHAPLSFRLPAGEAGTIPKKYDELIWNPKIYLYRFGI